MASPKQASAAAGGVRLGLCCLFRAQPVKFRTATATALLRLVPAARLEKLDELCRHNSAALPAALEIAQGLGIGAFRIISGLLPLATHPELGYEVAGLPGGGEVMANLRRAGQFASRHGIRLNFHPDQFIVLSSPDPRVVAASIADIENHAMLGEILGAETINVHAGGVYGDKTAALARFAAAVARLSPAARRRLTLENDDISYTPRDLLPVCRGLALPLVYDVHHHRCNPDGLGEDEASGLAAATWEGRGTPPHCHVSSPKDGWHGANPRPHADYIDPADFPACWLGRDLTVDVEAKAKELAVLRLAADLAGRPKA